MKKGMEMQEVKECKTERKTIQRSIGNSQQSYNTSPDLIFILDEDGRIIKNIGFRPAKPFININLAEGKSIIDIFPIEISYKLFAAAYQVFEKNIAAEIRFSIVENGVEIFYEAGLQHFQDKQIIVTLRKITHEKITCRLYGKLFETYPESILLLSQNGKIRMVNRRFLNTFRYRHEEDVLGKNILQFILFEDKIRMKKYLRHLLLTGSPSVAEIRFKNRRSGFIWIEITASVLFNEDSTEKELILSLKNITDKKAAEMAVSQSELRFKSVWENSSEGLCLIDKNGIIKIVNSSLCKIFELSQEEIQDKPYYILFNQEKINTEEVIRKFQKVYFVKNYYKQSHLKLTLKSKKYIELDTIQSFIECGDNSYLLSIFRDVTRLNEIDRLVNKNKKIAEVAKLASYIVHELKSPLACLKMNIDLLVRKTLSHEQTDTILNIMAKEIGRLSNILAEIMDFNKNGQLNLTEVAPFSLLENIKVLLSPVLVKNNISIINDIDESLIISCDAQKVHTALIHLIENSIEAIKEKGTIEVYSEANNKTGAVSLLIKDNGCGVKDKEKIFDPFYTTKATGVGLGLPIVRRIAVQHGGSARLVSVRPGETIFEISFNLGSKKNG